MENEQLAQVESGQVLTGYQPMPHEPEPLSRKLAFAGAALVVALISVFVLGSHFSTPEAYAGTIASLDAKRQTVTSLVGASTGSSAAITLLPGDVGTPIAEKLIDLSSDFTIVLAAIYLEKYLLTVLGFVSFRILIPVACVLFALAWFASRGSATRSVLLQLAAKLALFGVMAVLVVPSSVFVSNMIERTYESSIAQTIETAEQTADAVEDSAEATSTTGTTQTQQESQQQTGFIETIQQLPQAISQIPNAVDGVTEQAQRSINNFIEALAVMVVTSCVIPVLVLVFFLWLVRVILGINVNVPTRVLMPRSLGHGRHGA